MDMPPASLAAPPVLGAGAPAGNAVLDLNTELQDSACSTPYPVHPCMLMH
jgi:hypothetical protein